MADQVNASRADGVGALAERLAALRADGNSRIIGLTGSVALTRTIRLPDLLILEGLGFQSPSQPDRTGGEPDVLVYLDAAEVDLEAWYVERFVGFWNAARTDTASFYAQWLHMSEPELRAFAKTVWDGVNLPNLRDHIRPLRDHADIVVSKDASHTLFIVEDRIA